MSALRRQWIATAAGTALIAAVPLVALAAAGPADAGSPRSVPATVRTVVRPVTATGHAVSGYQVKKIKDSEPIDCSYPSASVAAVDDNILECSPDAAYPVACWPAAKAHHVLCLDDARKKTLVRFKVSGKIAHTSALHRRAPLNLELANGLYCGLRFGGAGEELQQHPGWGAFYYCTRGKAVWASLNSKDFGIDRTGHAWKVEVGRDTGTRDVRQQRVTQAYFVGTD